MNEIYYGTTCTKRTHRLSEALCKRAKESGEVVWLTEVSKTLQARSFRMLLFTSPHPHTTPSHTHSHTTLTHHPHTHPHTHPRTHPHTHPLTHPHTRPHTHHPHTHPHIYPHTHVPPQSTEGDVEALRSAISEVRTAVAVPVMTHGINVTVIFFYVRRFEITRPAVDFVVHMSLSAAIAIA